MATRLSIPLQERLVRVASELKVCRILGKDPYGWLSASDLELAINNGLLERDPNEQPCHDDQ